MTGLAHACRPHRGVLEALVERGERGPTVGAALDHLETCATCERDLTELALTVAALRRAGRELRAAPVPEPSPARLVLYRRELSIVHCRLRRAPFALLDALARGVSLGNACEIACALGDDEAASVEREVATWFTDWVARGFIVGVR